MGAPVPLVVLRLSWMWFSEVMGQKEPAAVKMVQAVLKMGKGCRVGGSQWVRSSHLMGRNWTAFGSMPPRCALFVFWFDKKKKEGFRRECEVRNYKSSCPTQCPTSCCVGRRYLLHYGPVLGQLA
jgi:hypothetical protein